MISEIFTPWQFKLLTLINPSIFLTVAVILGTVFYQRAGFRLPIIESWIFSKPWPPVLPIVKAGILGGLLAGILITLISLIFYQHLPEDFIALGKQYAPTLPARFLYGGITEEILIRFGLMSFLAWLFSTFLKRKTAAIYWTSILLAALIFALGHLPLVLLLTSTPTALLISYILIGNGLGGIIFGYLYWKKGLESAILGHIFAHVAMLLGEILLV